MPLHKYTCPSCGERYDELQNYDEAEHSRITCGCGTEMKREIGTPMLDFRGQGFTRRTSNTAMWQP
jgi:putative FmdB family regulatory protein